MYMRLAKIPKHNGTFRTVAVPTKVEQKKLDGRMLAATYLMKSVCGKHVHGFFPRRSPVTNARAHIGYNHSICFDIKDFFDSVTRDKLRALAEPNVDAFLDDTRNDICFLDGVAKQGLSTSPALANVAGHAIDKAIIDQLAALGLSSAAYTRYADDLTVSFNSRNSVALIEAIVTNAVTGCGYVLATNKTKYYCGTHGSLRKITGVCVGLDGVVASRESRRKLRAAKHQGNDSSARGLEEWCKLRTTVPEDSLFFALCSVAGLSPREVDKPLESSAFTHFRLTNDPAMILGVATLCRRSGAFGISKGAKRLYNLALAPDVFVAYSSSHNSASFGAHRNLPSVRAAFLVFRIGGAWWYDSMPLVRTHRSDSDSLLHHMRSYSMRPITEHGYEELELPAMRLYIPHLYVPAGLYVRREGTKQARLTTSDPVPPISVDRGIGYSYTATTVLVASAVGSVNITGVVI